MNRRIRASVMAFVALSMSACMTVGPDYEAPALGAISVPETWSANVPVKGRKAEDLSQWWARLNDPVLNELIDAAQASSPTLEKALSRIRQARADHATAQSDWLPKFDVTYKKTRDGGLRSDRRDNRIPITSTQSGVLDASWELDLFGGTRRAVEANEALIVASEAGWHDARVSLAAEVATTYAERRYCEAVEKIAAEDLESRIETLRLTRLKTDAGFSSASDADRADASVAEAESTLKAQQGRCKRLINQLVQLSGLPYEVLASKFDAGRGVVPTSETMSIETIPAEAIKQRPDVAAAERTAAAASAGIGVAQAARLPSLSLIGSIGVNQVRGQKIARQTVNRPWSFGPQITLPLFDGGSGKAAVEYARGQYDEAIADYKASVRSAVLEVENALVGVDTSLRRTDDVKRAVEGYSRFFSATEAQYREGAASLLALEEARRVLLISLQEEVGTQLELIQSWIALYKSVGGGWHADTQDVRSESSTISDATVSMRNQ
ncbi:efflux transporter outer membrane subunit [Denitromonas iodatirespirans]|uniref:Efflux transporter outer membrane subunit n=1 Tax=Denitromonas iodatirespirans TaxID=2795389 RepID=A0A944DFI3_DENI1|nr:efflux transporter outer membrane subunit [Denitromonas iodatirespirans]MBT0964146.1 efflux transporter outer membrane subunit [Denitromonas iodatirespirans]